MTSKATNKAVIVGITAGALLIGGALLLNWLQGKQGTGSQELIEEIEKLGPVKKEMNGMLSFPYFKDLMSIVQKHAKAKYHDEKRDLLAKRRKFLQEQNQAEYKEVVQEIIKKEESVFQDIMMEALEHIGLTEQEFMQVNEMYMRNPQTSQIIMQ